MLKLNEAQWQALQQGETRGFVVGVCDDFLRNRPEMLAQLGRKVVLARMQAAYDYAIRIGFASTPHVVRLMYLSADAPGIHDDKLVDYYLRKPGATPEQRLDEIDAIVKLKLKGDR
jgi:hypothetical protein